MAAKTKTPARKRTTTQTSPAAAQDEQVAGASTEAATADGPRPDPKGKLGAVIALLRRPEGAQLADMMAATGWQAHSVRGAISGAIKKKLGLTVASDKTEAGRVYRIATPEAELQA